MRKIKVEEIKFIEENEISERINEGIAGKTFIPFESAYQTKYNDYRKTP